MSIEEENTENASRTETGSELRIRLEQLPGVGSIRAAKLAKLGLVTVRDALMHFPRDYRDFTGKHCLDELIEGEHASLGGTVLSAFLRTISRGRTMLSVELETDQRIAVQPCKMVPAPGCDAGSGSLALGDRVATKRLARCGIHFQKI